MVSLFTSFIKRHGRGFYPRQDGHLLDAVTLPAGMWSEQTGTMAYSPSDIPIEEALESEEGLFLNFVSKVQQCLQRKQSMET